jgi:hypothetical protein
MTEQLPEGAVKVDLYDAAQGKVPRTGGPYLDDVERRNAEEWRAKQEGREPDYANPPAVAATVLVPKHFLVERDTDKSHFSDAVEVTNEPVDSFIVEAPVSEPDPTQADWDNDASKLAALEASKKFEELKNNSAPATTETTVPVDGAPNPDENPEKQDY